MSGKREKIIAAAYAILSSGNYQNMTTSRIAAEAGVAEGTLYRYFGNKGEMLFAVLSHYGECLVERIFAGASSERTFRANMQHFIDAFYKSLGDDIRFYRIMYKVYSEIDNAAILPAIRNNFTTNLQRSREVFEWAAERGEINISEAEIDLIVQNLWGMADGFIKRVLFEMDLPVKKEEVIYSMDLVMRAIEGRN